MTNEQLEELLTDYVDDALAPDERATVDAALHDDPALAAQVAQLRRLRRLVRALPDEDAPPSLTHAVFAATTRRRWALKDKLPRWSDFLGPLPVAAAALVAFVAIAGAIFGYFQINRVSPPSTTLTLAKSAPLSKTSALAGEEKLHAARTPAPEADAAVYARNSIPDYKALVATRGSTHLQAATPPATAPRERKLEAADDLAGAGQGALPQAAAKQQAGRGQRLRQDLASLPLAAAPPPAPPAAKPSQDENAPTGGVGQTGVANQEAANDMETESKSAGQKNEVATAISRRWDGAHSAGMRAAVIAAVDAASWKRLWQSMHANIVEKTPEPDIDFDKQAVIAVFMGAKPTGGFATRVIDVRRDGNALRVIVRETAPNPGDMVTESLTQPFSVVIVPREIDGLHIQEDTPLKIERR